MQRTLFDTDHESFRETVRAFVEKEVSPHHESWEESGITPRDLWTKAGEQGLLGFMMPEVYGGGGVADFRFNAILAEELTRAHASGVGFMLHTDLVSGYLLSYADEEQKARWLPEFCTGETITALAMTEPGTGSDLQSIATTARRDGDHYIVNGQKTFISNGINADLVIVAVKTDPDADAQG
ncbi:MAG TPA: acyl-CoA dehydrogenase family protein, partial [Nocardioidaceae bacterium]|nr:acyl-CoA dehydrogenase family protein [Nocardioidaceae bacterium]